MSTLKLAISQSPVDQMTPVPVSITSNRASLEIQVQDQIRTSTSQETTRKTQETRGFQVLIDQMNQMARMLDKKYEFSVDKETNQLVVRVSDPETGELLHQIPPEELLKLASQLGEMMGLFLDEIA